MPSWNVSAHASLNRWPLAWAPETVLPLPSQLPSAWLRARPRWGSSQGGLCLHTHVPLPMGWDPLPPWVSQTDLQLSFQG